LAGWQEALERQARTRAKAGLTRTLRSRPAGDAVVDLAGNDYLGLAVHPEVIAASVRALRAYGLGATGSRLVRGSTDAHTALETELADWLGAEQSLVYSSGYLANLGAVRALAGPGTLLVSDRYNHASLIEAARARVRRSSSPRTPTRPRSRRSFMPTPAAPRCSSPSRCSPSTATSRPWPSCTR